MCIIWNTNRIIHRARRKVTITQTWNSHRQLSRALVLEGSASVISNGSLSSWISVCRMIPKQLKTRQYVCVCVRVCMMCVWRVCVHYACVEEVCVHYVCVRVCVRYVCVCALCVCGGCVCRTCVCMVVAGTQQCSLHDHFGFTHVPC